MLIFLSDPHRPDQSIIVWVCYYLGCADEFNYFEIEAITKFNQSKLAEIKQCIITCKIIIINNLSQFNIFKNRYR